MNKSNHHILFKSNWQTLFDYEQDSSRTAIRIFARQTLFTRRVDYDPYKGGTISRHTRFTLCGLDLSDSFEALSVALSLVKVFEQRQFGTGDKKLAMRFPTPNDGELQLFCSLEAYNKSYEGLRLGWMTRKNGHIVQKTHSMHIGYVHHLRNALHRAMSWISPETQVEFRNLPETVTGL